MAGEIEDPINFRMECSPTASISFGRFEAESLCWERRSSFSHNRYLEEVEKYSKPGSVIEKKAYFEAHFRRKALLLQASSEGQDGNEEQTTTENEMLDPVNYMEELEEHGNEGTEYTDYEYGNEGTHYADYEEHVSEPTHWGHYDEAPDDSEGCEYELKGCERKAEENFPYEFLMVPSPCNANEVSDNNVGHIELGDTLETQFAFATNVVINYVSEKEVEETLANQMENSKIEIEHVLANEAEKVDKLHGKADASMKTYKTVKDHLPSLEKLQKPSLKVKLITEQKATKPKVREQAVAAQVPRKISNEKASFSYVKDLTKTSRKMDRESPLRTKIEKRSPSKVPQTALPVPKILKSEDSENVKPKISQENRSERFPKAKKVSASAAQLALEKCEPERRISRNRPKQITSAAKPDLKVRGAVFSFKSEERAEKRKEFYSRLEEKLQAKEVEMNQIQAKTQEETVAEIKQLRRSLNFKATPMPSFYHEAVTQGSDSKKATITLMKSSKRQSKRTSLGSKLTGHCISSKAINQQDLPGDESTSCQQPQTQEASTPEANINCSSTTKGSNNIHEMGNSSRMSQAGKRIETRKKVGERRKGINSSSNSWIRR